MLEQLKDEFSHTDELIVITDGQPDPTESRVLFINQAFASLSGYKVDQIDAPNTLGFTIINTLKKQLEAEIEVE